MRLPIAHHRIEQATLHNRGADRSSIGTKLWDPNIDYAKMAQAYGMHGEGPITDPNELVPALKRGIEIVKKGEPAMIGVVTQPGRIANETNIPNRVFRSRSPASPVTSGRASGSHAAESGGLYWIRS